MKIAFFIRSMHGGGAQRAMVRLATGIGAAGYSVEVLTLESDGPYREELSPDIFVTTLKAKRTITATPALARYMRHEKPAGLFVTESACNIAIILAKLWSRSSTRVLIREGLFPSIAVRESPHRSARIAYLLAPILYRYADVIVAIASDMRHDLAAFARLNPSRVTMIPTNPVVTPSLLSAASSRPEHPWFGSSTPVILGVGRLDQQKDFMTLIRAFEIVRASRPCRLVVVGEGPLRPALEVERGKSQYASDMDFPGYVPQPFSLMANCDVFVLSSRYEGLPNVLIEALACGAPVVATDCPSGPRDVLANGRYGRLVPVGDVAAMASAVIATLDSPTDREVSRARGDDFTLAKSARRYLDALFPDERKP